MTTLLARESIDTSITGAEAHRIRYRSRDLRGRFTESTGLVIVPRGASDARVITWCHGTTGLGDAACPSLQPDPARELTTYFTPGSSAQIDYGIPGLQSLIDDGYIVCATDYQGLGTPGMHQYTVNRTNALDAIHIVHAAREMQVGAGTRIAAIGWSQGGGTAAALAELDDADFGDLELVASVLMSPGVPIVALRNPTGMGAALADPHAVPDGHLIMNLAALVAAFPEDLGMEDVFTPLGIDLVEQAWEHQPVHHFSDTVARTFRFRGPIMAVQPDRLAAWEDAFTEASAARVKPRCPILVAIDSFDGGTVIPVAWQTGYIDAIRALGGDIESREYPDADHFEVPTLSIDDARAWIATKF